MRNGFRVVTYAMMGFWMVGAAHAEMRGLPPPPPVPPSGVRPAVIPATPQVEAPQTQTASPAEVPASIPAQQVVQPEKPVVSIAPGWNDKSEDLRYEYDGGTNDLRTKREVETVQVEEVVVPDLHVQMANKVYKSFPLPPKTVEDPTPSWHSGMPPPEVPAYMKR